MDRLRLRHWMFLLLAGSLILIAFTKLIPGAMPGSPMRAYYDPVRWWLFPHIATGGIALLAGPFQFSNSLRRNRPKIHRTIGILYAVAVLISAPVAVTVSLLHVALVPSLAPMIQGLAWLVTTAIAWLMVRARNYAQHREWMIRSYAVTTTFVSTRLLFSIPAIDRLDPEGSAIIVLCAVTCTLLAAEIGIHISRNIGTKPSKVIAADGRGSNRRMLV